MLQWCRGSRRRWQSRCGLRRLGFWKGVRRRRRDRQGEGAGRVDCIPERIWAVYGASWANQGEVRYGL